MESGELQTDRRGGELKKLDLYRRHKTEYLAPRSPHVIAVGAARYLAIEGQGPPAAPAFAAAIGALYSVAFTIKMAKKFAGLDYAVAKLEGLWWGGRAGRLLLDEPPARWRWQLLIRVPAFIAERDRRQALATLAQRGKSPLVRQVRLLTLREGRCVQLLHVGPYDQERESLARMDLYARSKGLCAHGRHHEIYLSDPRRVAPAKLRTLLRQPVRRA